MKNNLEDIQPTEAKLLFEAGEALAEIRKSCIPKGSSQAFRLDRPYELKSALAEYPKEKIQAYQEVLKKYDLTERAERLKENYASLEKLAKAYSDGPRMAYPTQGGRLKI